MKIVIAPDSFKGSSSSMAVASRIEKGILKVFPEAQTVKIPIADGGEGTVDALIRGAGGDIYTTSVTGPMGEDIDAQFAILANGTAALEMAASSGLPLVPQDRRNPLLATTYGVGQMILAAIGKGATEIVIGLGGSATNDGGAGMAQALGCSLQDDGGRELDFGGGALEHLARIDISGLDPRIKDVKIKIASDVSNPLCGLVGASAIFGPQKGAGPEMVAQLDRNLAHYADIVKATIGRDMAEIPGAGAAGGLGFGLLAFCGASIGSGIETMLDAVSFDEKLTGVCLCITGEGRIDGQSAFGKVPVGVAGRAKKQNIPVLAIVGGIGDGAQAVYDFGIDSIMSIVDCPMPLDDAMANAGELIEDAAERAMRMVRIGQMIDKNRQI